MRRQQTGLALILVLMAGCGNFRKGDVYGVSGTAMLYLDEKAYEDNRQLHDANVSPDINTIFKLRDEGKMTYLDNGAQVRIVESAPGGAKVAVISGKNEGKLGWMMAHHLAEQQKIEK